MSPGGKVHASRVRTSRRWVLVMFSAGTLLSFGMAFRSQVGMDQFRLLIGGWLFAEAGILLPFGNPMSGGGYEPGTLTNVLVGLPLLLWRDYRAVSLSMLLVHVLAYLLLDRMVSRILSPRERVFFGVLYWLNPWRIYFSAHLWNPNYLFLLGAVHTYTAFRQRTSKAFWATFFHVTVIGLAFQIHGSFLILAIASLFLYVAGQMKIHWTGAACAVATVIVTLAPWIHFAGQHPEILPIHEGYLGRGLLAVYPVLRGVLYWIRYSSLYIGKQMIRVDFTPFLGARVDGLLAPISLFVSFFVAPLSVLPVIVANFHTARRVLRSGLGLFRQVSSGRVWVRRTVACYFLAALVTFALSPTTIMMWQALIVLHVAVIPLVMYVGVWARKGLPRRLAYGAMAWASVLAIIVLSVSVAGPMYRKGGRVSVNVKMSSIPVMATELGIVKHATFTLDGRAASYEGPELKECTHESHPGILRLPVRNSSGAEQSTARLR